MVFISIEDFYEKAEKCQVLTRQGERECAQRMKQGDVDARALLFESYLPMTARHVQRAKPEMQTLSLALYCVDALEKAVDSFNFLQDSETFTHRLSWYLRNATAKYIAEH
jgi:DNA-directed RNA polymerase sigma subunit (sigma70/sigma32)